MIAKTISMIRWGFLFAWMLKNRGPNSFGIYDVKNSLDLFVNMKKSSYKNLKAAEVFITKVERLLRPHISSWPLIRCGPPGDAGYTIARLNSLDYVLSGGAGKNIDFELELARNGSKVFICDPYVKCLPVTHENIVHYKKKLSSKKSKIFSLRSWDLIDFYEHIKITRESTKLLKLDIEGDEIELLGNKAISLADYDQIVIEIHNLFELNSSVSIIKFETLINNLFKDHKCIYLNSNNNGILLNFGNKFLPEVVELTLLNNRYFKPDSIQSLDAPKFDNALNNAKRLPIPNFMALNKFLSG